MYALPPYPSIRLFNRGRYTSQAATISTGSFPCVLSQCRAWKSVPLLVFPPSVWRGVDPGFATEPLVHLANTIRIHLAVPRNDRIPQYERFSSRHGQRLLMEVPRAGQICEGV